MNDDVNRTTINIIVEPILPHGDDTSQTQRQNLIPPSNALRPRVLYEGHSRSRRRECLNSCPADPSDSAQTSPARRSSRAQSVDRNQTNDLEISEGKANLRSPTVAEKNLEGQGAPQELPAHGSPRQRP